MWSRSHHLKWPSKAGGVLNSDSQYDIHNRSLILVTWDRFSLHGLEKPRLRLPVDFSNRTKKGLCSVMQIGFPGMSGLQSYTRWHSGIYVTCKQSRSYHIGSQRLTRCQLSSRGGQTETPLTPIYDKSADRFFFWDLLCIYRWSDSTTWDWNEHRLLSVLGLAERRWQRPSRWKVKHCSFQVSPIKIEQNLLSLGLSKNISARSSWIIIQKPMIALKTKVQS